MSFFFYSGYLKEHLIKEGQCFKCGKQSHHSTDPDAQYQGQFAVPDKQLLLNIKKMTKKTSF